MSKFYKFFLVLLAFAPFASKANDSCQVNFTVTTGSNTLTKIFVAQPWNSNQNAVEQICWKFGDGTDTCITAAAGTVPPFTIQHNYLQPGVYTVCVKVKFIGGCIAERCNTVQVGANTQPDSCKADYTVTGGNIAPATKVFTPIAWHNHNKPVTEVRWDFGDGSTLVTSALSPITHTYTVAGNYTVCIRIKYDGGCVSEKCHPLAIANPVIDSCRADFTVSNGTVFNAKIFTPVAWHNNQNPVTEVRWNFGDGSPAVISANLSPVTHLYAQPGTYNVCIRIKYDGGCVSEKCKPLIIVNPVADSCAANFQVLQANATTLTRYFAAQPWHNNQKPPVQICWKFGDGTDTCLNAVPGATTPLNISHTYAQPGNYTVCIRIKYLGDCVAEKCNNIVVNPPVDSCTANFEMSPINSTPLGRKFTAVPWNSAGKKPREVCWTFGDGRDTCIPYTESYTGLYFTNHVYNQPGTYNVCVKIKYFGGCVAEKCKPVVIGTPPADSCRADFEVLPVAGTILSKTFLAKPWHSQNKRPEQICWKFGDGTDTCITYNPAISYNYIVTHSYLQPGTYTVCVKIKYQGGCVSEKCKPVVVGVNTIPDSCRADFETTSYTSTPRTKKFTALPWHNNQKRPEKICWDFGDGHDTCITYNPGNAANVYSVLHTYAQNGIYNVCVKIKYQGGCEAQKCRQVPVNVTTQPDSCNAYFTEEVIQNSGLYRRFNAIPWHSNQKRPEKICWQFGDGTDTCITYNPGTATAYNVVHHYNQPGVYTVCVKIKYQGGCEAQYCRPVAVEVQPCRALFTDSMISRFKVKFKGQAIIAQPNNPVVSWQWTFGDGTSGTGQNVIHEFPHPGSYTVCLKITTANGCQNTVCKVKVIDSGVRILQLHPNPVINTLYITYYSYHNEMGQVKIYNMFGIMVRSFNRQMTIGYNNFSTDVSTLPPGPYSLVVQTPTATAASVFFKQ